MTHAQKGFKAFTLINHGKQPINLCRSAEKDAHSINKSGGKFTPNVQIT